MIVIGYILIIIASIAKAVMDKVNFHFDKSIFNNKKLNKKFWDKRLSHLNKWEEYQPKTRVGKFAKHFLLNPLEYLFKKFTLIFNSLKFPWSIDSSLTVRATILVFTTDAWHLFQSIMLFSIFTGTLLIFSESSLLSNVIHFVATNILFRLVFTFTFHTLLQKK